MNEVKLIGNLGRDAEKRESHVRLSVATNDGYRKDGKWVDRTTWHSIAVFGKAAERCTDLRKGQSVLVTGRLNGYKDKEGKYHVDIAASNVWPLERQARDSRDAPAAAQPKLAEVGEGCGDGDDEIPF